MIKIDENKKNDFRLRLSIFEKKGKPEKKNVTKPPPSNTGQLIRKTITEKMKDLKLDTQKVK